MNKRTVAKWLWFIVVLEMIYVVGMLLWVCMERSKESLFPTEGVPGLAGGEDQD